MNKKHIKNDFFSIFQDFDDFKESKNFFHYHFFTDFNLSGNPDNIDDFNNLFNKKIKETPHHLCFDIPVNLFGPSKSFKEEIYKFPAEHCMISSMHTIRYLLSRKESLMTATTKSTCDLIRKINAEQEKEYYTMGYHTLSFYYKNKMAFSDSIQDFSTFTSSDFGSRIGKLKKQKLSSWEKQIIYSNDPENKDFLLSKHNLDLYMHLFYLGNALRATEKESFINLKADRVVTFAENYNYLGKANTFKLNEEPSNNSKFKELKKCTQIDQLILQYQLERLFNVSLINNLLSVSDEKKEELQKQSPDVLMKFCLIPDIFNRKRYLDWAVTNLGEKGIYNNHLDFPKWVDKNILHNLNYDIDKNIYINNITISSTWATAISYGIDYLSYVYYPFFEKYYFIQLYEILRESDNSNNDEFDYDILKKMEKLLFEACVHISLNKLETLANLDLSDTVGKLTPHEKIFFIDLIKNLIGNGSETEYLFQKYFDRKFSSNYFGLLNANDYDNKRNLLGDIYNNLIQHLVIPSKQ